MLRGFLCTVVAALLPMAPLACASSSPNGEPPSPPGYGPTSASPEHLLHLVIDLGSSGTRFCLYDVTRAPSTRTCSIGVAEALCAKSQGGLATLTIGKPAGDVPAIVEPKLEAAWQSLVTAYVASGKPASDLGVLRAAAALGTGGFRDPATAAPAVKPEWDAVWATIARFLQGKGLTQIVAKAIPGDDEARLAWVGVREALAPKGPFAILETGGATLQLASGAPSDAYDALAAASIYRGQDYQFQELSADPEFRVCYSPTDRSVQDGPACIAYLARKVHSGNAIATLAKSVSQRTLYGLGAWTGLLAEFPNAPPWPAKTNTDVGSGITIANVHALAAKVCPLADADIKTFAPNSYDVKNGLGRACYAVAYEAAFVDSVSTIAADATIVPGGNDQWARGASVTPKFFADCP